MSAPVMNPPSTVRTVVPASATLPQVNLLPPEVTAGRRLGRVKAWLGVALLMTVLVVGLAYVGTSYLAANAEAELERVEQQNQALVQEQAQYAEVPQVLGQLAEATAARELAMSTEVLWGPYHAALAATAPAGVSFDTFSAVVVTPSETPVVQDNPLARPTVGTLTFGARSLTLPDTAAWMDSVAAVPGFADPWFTSAQLTDEQGTVYYQVNGTVHVTDEAYAERFATTEGEG